MRAVVQRVTRAAVSVDKQVSGQIASGLLVLVGFTGGDGDKDLRWMARKVTNLRVFRDEAGKMNRSVIDTGGSLLVVSQFTLYGDCKKGNRPSFDQAAPPETANQLYEQWVDMLKGGGISVETGVFQAHMAVSLVNDGPVTILLDSVEAP